MPRHLTGGGTPSAVAASTGSQSQTAQAWRNADRANSSASACGSGLSRMSSQSSTYSPSCPSHRAAAGRGSRPRSHRAPGTRRRRRRPARGSDPPATTRSRPVGHPSVAHDEVVRRWIGRPSREEADREVEGAPPGVDRRRASAKRRPKCGEDERRAGGGLEVGRDLVGVIGRMLVVLVQRNLSTAPPGGWD